MKYIFCILLAINLLFGNDELNSYLNNKDLQHSIIKDEKNNRIIIDLLYDLKGSSRVIIFTKDNNRIYKKTFDEKLYFCQNIKYSNAMVVNRHDKVYITCSIPNIDDGYYREFYDFGKLSNLDDKLLSIEKQYINIDDDSIKAKYIFKPQKDIPTLKDYTNEDFSEKYLDENHKNFIKISNPNSQSKNIQIKTEKEKSFFSKLLEWFGFSKLNGNMSFVYS